MRLLKILSVGGLTFFTACTTTSLDVQPHHEKYGIQLIQVYCADVKRPIDAEKIIASGSEIEDFPVIYINQGETKTGGDLTPVVVAQRVTELNGVPTIAANDKEVIQLGKSITAHLKIVDNNMVVLDYKLINRKLKEFKEMQSSGGDYTIKMPAFNDKSASSTINAKLDEWTFLGSNNKSSILVRVLSPSSDHIKDLSVEQIKKISFKFI